MISMLKATPMESPKQAFGREKTDCIFFRHFVRSGCPEENAVFKQI
ncbi:MAG: hypothetical protein Ct9H300mP7_2200 [Verrucomicrobiota bacterium]|nr:MAG: hypothetical protein Ct9H300mP7_2200 [Verrucomicrobiota bacterium]